MMLDKKLMIVLAALSITDCSVGPDYNEPQEFSREVLQRELPQLPQDEISREWYKSWNDDVLNQLIVLGLENNTEIAVAVSRLKQSRAKLRMTTANYLPTTDIQSGFNYEKNSKKIAASADVHYYSMGFDASWEIDIWGKNRRQAESDEAGIKSADYTLKHIKSLITAEIMMQYIYWNADLKRLRLAERNLAQQAELVQITKHKFENGMSDEISVKQAQYQYNDIQAGIPELRENLEQYRNALSVLTGINPSQLPIKENRLSPLFSGKNIVELQFLNRLPLDVIRRRPDVSAAEQDLIKQNAQIGKAVAELYPSLNVSAIWGYASQGGKELFGSKSQTFSYNPLISMPLLDWNRLQNNVKLQKYLRDEYFQQYKKTVLNAIAEIRNAIVQYQQSLAKQQARTKALVTSREVMEMTLDKYKKGLVDFSEVLNSRQNYLQAQNNSVADQTDLYQSIVTYSKAVGSGYL